MLKKWELTERCKIMSKNNFSKSIYSIRVDSYFGVQKFRTIIRKVSNNNKLRHYTLIINVPL